MGAEYAGMVYYWTGVPRQPYSLSIHSCTARVQVILVSLDYNVMCMIGQCHANPKLLRNIGDGPKRLTCRTPRGEYSEADHSVSGDKNGSQQHNLTIRLPSHCCRGVCRVFAPCVPPCRTVAEWARTQPLVAPPVPAPCAWRSRADSLCARAYVDEPIRPGYCALQTKTNNPPHKQADNVIV